MYAANVKRLEVVDKAITEWIGKMEKLMKMWEDQAGQEHPHLLVLQHINNSPFILTLLPPPQLRPTR